MLHKTNFFFCCVGLLFTPYFGVPANAREVELFLLDSSAMSAVVPNAVSADGSTVVGRAVFPVADTTAQRAFTWRFGEDFRTLPPVLGASASSANAVSDDASVVVGSTNNTVFQHSVAVRWASSGEVFPIFFSFIDQTSPDQSVLTRTTEGIAVSGDGMVAAGFHRNESNDVRAFKWVEGSFTSFGEILQGTARASGRHFNRINAISGNGRYAAGWSDAATNSGGSPVQGFRLDLQTGAVIALGYLPGGANQSTAEAISADGSVIAGFASSTIDGATGAQYFRWTAESGMVGLGFFYGSGVNRLALSGDGQTIVGAENGRALLWNSIEGKVFLDSIAPALANWEMTYATGVSHDGRVISGFGFPPGSATGSGNEVGWVVRIVEPDVPPPPPTPDLIISLESGRIVLRFHGDATATAWLYRVEDSRNLSGWSPLLTVQPMGTGNPPLVDFPPGDRTVTTTVDDDHFGIEFSEVPPTEVFYRLFPALPE